MMMNYRALITTLCLGITLCAGATERARAFICADDGRRHVAVFNEAKELVWKYPAKKPYVAQLTAGGNVLLATGYGVKLVSPAKIVLWEYKTTSEVYGTDIFDDGRVIVGECTTGLILILDQQGKKLSSFKTQYKVGGHMTMRYIRLTAQNTVLGGHLGDSCVREYNLDGTLVHEFKVASMAYVGIREKNGHTLVSHKTGVTEFDDKNNLVWELKDSEIPAMKCQWINTIYRSQNGNIVVGNWLGYSNKDQETPLFEVTRDKKIVWKISDTEALKQVTHYQELNSEQLALFSKNTKE